MLQYYTALVSSHVEAFVAALDREEEGQGLVEYALIIVLVSIAAIGTLTILGGKVSDVFQFISDKLATP
jgi:pilus assembly protein Flp/PilA